MLKHKANIKKVKNKRIYRVFFFANLLFLNSCSIFNGFFHSEQKLPAYLLRENITEFNKKETVRDLALSYIFLNKSLFLCNEDKRKIKQINNQNQN